MQPYSLDSRTRIVAALRQPRFRRAAVAERFGVSVALIEKLLAHEQQTGPHWLAPKPASGGRARYRNAAAQVWLVAYVREHPDATQAHGLPGLPGAGLAGLAARGPDLPLAGAG